jgi:RNA polymerase sigma-70 factor (ECF subfamily)
METTAELQLLRQFAATRDAEAFCAILRRHQDLVYGTCLRILGDAAEAGKATRQCFLRLAGHAGWVDGPVADWLHGCATFVSLDALRRRPARPAVEGPGQRAQAVATGQALGRAAPARVDAALEELPDELRRAFVERFLLRRGPEEIARELHLAAGTVHRWLRRAVRRVRRTLRSAGVGVSAAALVSLFEGATAAGAPAEVSYDLGKIALAGIGWAARPRSASHRRTETSSQGCESRGESACGRPAAAGWAAFTLGLGRRQSQECGTS